MEEEICNGNGIYQMLLGMYRSSCPEGTRLKREIDHVFSTTRIETLNKLVPMAYDDGEKHKGIPDHRPIVVEV
jgi:hypothetical protein